ncbi:Vesicular glutamate transporter 3, partial [Gryllus bimaculatus]
PSPLCKWGGVGRGGGGALSRAARRSGLRERNEAVREARGSRADVAWRSVLAGASRAPWANSRRPPAGFFNVYALRVNLSVAIVAMTANRTVVAENGTLEYEQEFAWDSKMQGLLLSAFFWGYLVTQIPGGWLAARVGGNRLFGFGLAATALLTLLTPPLARAGAYWLLALRVAEGLFEGVTFPCMHAVWARWAPPLERSRMAAIAFSGSYVGTVVAMPVCGLLANTVGWPSIFYVFDTLHFDLKQAGFMSGLPYLAMAIVLQIAGQLADVLRERRILTTTQVRRLFNCGAFLGQTVFMLLATALPSPAAVVACLTAAVGCGAFALAGYGVNHLDIAPQHASVLMGLSNTVATLPGIISPTVTGFLVQHHSAEEWKSVFYISSGIYLVGVVVYGLFASGELQSWAEPQPQPQSPPPPPPQLEMHAYDNRAMDER